MIDTSSKANCVAKLDLMPQPDSKLKNTQHDIVVIAQG